jgi:hypothetical protein
MTDTIIIALTGRAGSGKTAAADHLERTYGFKAVGFADALKDVLAMALDQHGIDHAWLYEPAMKSRPIPGLGITPRELMQRTGDHFRSLHSRWWIDAALRTIGAPHSPVHDRLCITDVRYPDELAHLRALRWPLHLIRLQRTQAEAVREHSSEAHTDDMPADTLILNDGPTLSGLHAMLDGTMASLGIEPREDTLYWRDTLPLSLSA